MRAMVTQYIFSSIFNGYSPKYLKKYCKFALIKEYLPKFRQNKNQILLLERK